jgi:glycerophosphoryl diester phosphodiesterase
MKKAFFALAAVAVLVVYLVNTSRLAKREPGKPTLLAHRGMAQRFDTHGLANDTCTAARMLSPTHRYLENTVASMRAGFDAGADIVEIDVHPTTDGHFAVFHDWTLDCRTEGRGRTRDHSMEALRRLDVGYGYTADGGRTFPLRGTGVGLMPSLDDVLAAFPTQRFVINIKSRDPREGQQLASALGRLPPAHQDRFIVYGGDEPIQEVRRLLPTVRTASRASLKSCLLRYIGLGWSGHVPDACRRSMVLVPVNVAPWLWGWPDRFLNRMEVAGSRVFVLGPYQGEAFSTGLDTAEDLARLPPGYSGGIWTDEVERVGRLLGRR